MSQTWQTVLAVTVGLLAATFAMWFVKRKPKWRRVVEISFAVAAVFVAVMIGLGHFDRLDAVWPAAFAVNILANGIDVTPAKAPRAASSRPAPRS